jgi:plastocyanin
VAIDKFAFDPEELTVAVGDTVVWTNAEGVGHSVVSGDDTFASDRLEQGDAFEFTFDTAGTFAYICGIHPSMAGTVVVE